MNKVLLIVLISGFSITGFSQGNSVSNNSKYTGSTECGLLIVDLSYGSVNGLNPVSSPDQIKGKLPCFTGMTPETSAENCNGGIFYKTRDIYFYTSLDCINIRSKFEGSFVYNRQSIQLIGVSLTELQKIFGKESDYYRSPSSSTHKYPVFTTSYGHVVFDLVNDHVVEVNICNQKKIDLRLCN